MLFDVDAHKDTGSVTVKLKQYGFPKNAKVASLPAILIDVVELSSTLFHKRSNPLTFDVTFIKIEDDPLSHRVVLPTDVITGTVGPGITVTVMLEVAVQPPETVALTV